MQLQLSLSLPKEHTSNILCAAGGAVGPAFTKAVTDFRLQLGADILMHS